MVVVTGSARAARKIALVAWMTEGGLTSPPLKVTGPVMISRWVADKDICTKVV